MRTKSVHRLTDALKSEQEVLCQRVLTRSNKYVLTSITKDPTLTNKPALDCSCTPVGHVTTSRQAWGGCALHLCLGNGGPTAHTQAMCIGLKLRSARFVILERLRGLVQRNHGRTAWLGKDSEPSWDSRPRCPVLPSIPP